MRKKGVAIGKKRAKREQRSSNEVTLARLAAAKLKREKTITMVKDRLEVKFKQRIGLLQDEGKRGEVFGSESKSPIEKIMAEIRAEMKDVMLAGVKKVHAAKILGERVKFDVKSSSMIISGRKYRIKKNVHAIGWGREALALTSALERIIGDNMKKGLVVVPRGTISEMFAQPELFPKLDTHIRIIETKTLTGDRIPDDVCVRANKNIADYCKKLKKKDILMMMFSPSSDDLLCLPREKIELSEKNLLLETLASAGATERDILLARTALSAIRGGRLAILAHPAKVLCLVMSDLGADEFYLAYICGGPNIETDHRALSITRKILEKYNVSVYEQSQGIRDVLLANNHGELSSEGGSGASPHGSSPFKSSVDNIVVASSRDSLDEMALAVFNRGYVPIKIYGITASPSCQISLRRMSQDYALLASLMILVAEEKITRTEMYDKIRENIVSLDLTEETPVFPSKENWARGLYLLVCPSSSRFLRSSRSAGALANNQQLAIFFSLDWYLRVEQYPILKEYIVWFLGGASSGRDGNTRYSGAYAYGNLAVDVYRKFVMPPINLYEEGLKTDTAENPVSREEKRRIHESMLPHKVIASEQPNFFFRNVNAGAELLELTGSNDETNTKVGDLHILRIVRSPCRCCCCSLDHLAFSER